MDVRAWMGGWPYAIGRLVVGALLLAALGAYLFGGVLDRAAHRYEKARAWWQSATAAPYVKLEGERNRRARTTRLRVEFAVVPEDMTDYPGPYKRRVTIEGEHPTTEKVELRYTGEWVPTTQYGDDYERRLRIERIMLAWELAALEREARPSLGDVAVLVGVGLLGAWLMVAAIRERVRSYRRRAYYAEHLRGQDQG